MLLLDGELHDSLRRSIAGLTSPKRVSAILDKMSPRIDALFLKAALSSEEVDLIQEVLVPLVAEFALRLVGLEGPEARRAVPQVASTLGLLEQLASEESGEALIRMVHLARTIRLGMPEGGASSLESEEISSAQMHLTAAVFVHGAFENPLNFLSLLFAKVVRTPQASRRREILAEGTDDRSSFSRLVAELAPVQKVLRWYDETADAQNGPVKGDPVWIDLASTVERTIETRSSRTELGFGAGPHRCPGEGATRELTSRLANAFVDAFDSKVLVRRTDSIDGWVTAGIHRLVVVAD